MVTSLLKSRSRLGSMLRHAPLARDDLPKELSRTLWRTTGSISERASSRLVGSAANIVLSAVQYWSSDPLSFFGEFGSPAGAKTRNLEKGPCDFTGERLL